MKEKLQSALGVFGTVLYFALLLLLAVYPFVFIDVHWLLMGLFIMISASFPPAGLVFWIWGLINVIGGPQTFWVILYYVLFAIAMLPTVISFTVSLFKR